MNQHYHIERTEARQLLSFVANQVLNERERDCVEALAYGVTCKQTGAELALTGGGVWMAQQAALKKMRHYLETLGLTSTGQLLTTR